MNRPIIIILLVLLGLAISSHALALQLEYPDWFLKETRQRIEAGESIRFGEFVLGLFNIFLIVAGVAAFVMIVIGGIRYLTSIGNPSVTTDAKNQVFSAFLGLALLLGSYLILNTINPQLVELKEPELREVRKVVLPSVGKIKVLVEKPIKIDPPKEFGFDTGPHKIFLKESYGLLIDTDNMKASLHATGTDPATGDPIEIKFWEKGKNEEDLEEGKEIRYEKDIEITQQGIDNLPVGTIMPTKFTISVGKKKPEELLISYGIDLPKPFDDLKEETRIPIPAQKWEKNLQVLGLTLTKLIIEPKAQNLQITLEVGPCAIPLAPCHKIPKDLSADGKIGIDKEVSLPDAEWLPDALRGITIKGWADVEWSK